jgi:adenylate cyclase
MRSTILVLSLFLLFCKQQTIAIPKAEAGVIDLRNWDIRKNGIIQLDGAWEFYWKEFLESKDFKNQDNSNPIYISFPSVWNQFNYKNETLPARGYATFRMRVNFAKNSPPIALRTREQATSYAVFWNGEKILSAGAVGKNEETARAHYQNTQVFLGSPTEEVEIIYWISNYDHRSGGAWHSLQLGTHEDIGKETSFFREMDFFLAGIIFIMVLYHLFLYFYRKTDVSNILFSAFCFAILLRSLSTGERIINSYFQLPFWFYIRLEYITWYMSMPLGYHFLSTQFSNHYLNKFTTLNYFISNIMSLGLIFPPFIFTQFVPYYQIIYFAFLFLGFGYLIYFVYKKLQGSRLLLSGFLFMLLTAINDLLYTNQWIDSFYLSHYGLAFLIFSQSLSISIRFSKAFNSIEGLTEDLRLVNKAYSRFVPKEFLNFLNKQSITEIFLGEQVQREMSILFSDIRSFTELSEKLSPKDNFNFLNSYLSRMGPIVRSHGGFIDKYIGDGIMALFPGSIENALDSAIAMQQEIRIYNQQRMNFQYDSIRVGIGIHTGPMILGTIGEEERMESTVISDAVNLASRIEGLTKTYGAYILISEFALQNLANTEKYTYRILDRVKVKGKSNTIAVYEIFNGMSDYLYELHSQTKTDFEKGLHHFWSNEFSEAIESFQRVIDIFPSDIATLHFLELAQKRQS